VNVVKPANAKPGSKYPVLVVGDFNLPNFYGIQATHFQWIYGGGFEIGGPSMCASILLGLPTFSDNGFCRYDGGKVVERSIELKQPIIYVSINYR
jgi:acetylcholinesterase